MQSVMFEKKIAAYVNSFILQY
uniref:Uncharacterized protein n=1 Tax=Arundo donax TaxID=35708 RepID=A0A0A9ATL9_ARUDO